MDPRAVAQRAESYLKFRDSRHVLLRSEAEFSISIRSATILKHAGYI